MAGDATVNGFTRRLEVRIDRERWERLQELCKGHGVAISETVRQAIDDSYDRYERGEL